MIREIDHAESRVRVWLDGKGLQDIDPAVVVLDVAYQVPAISTQTVEHARYHGSRVTRQKMGNSTVSIGFEIHEYNTAFRQSIAERVTAWAMSGGVLTTDDKPGKRLHVVCITPPAIMSTKGWTNRLTMSFAAFDNPFWEDVSPTTLILSGASGSGNIYAPGSASDPFVEADVKPTDTLTSLTLTAGDTSFVLSGISIPSGKELSIYYDEKQTLHIERKDTKASFLSKRTATSDDDLMIERGKFSAVSYTANVNCAVTFKARGLYL